MELRTGGHGLTVPTPRVLVVDDEADTRAIITGKLAQAGFIVSEAADAIAGLATVRAEMPDLVVMDIWMPGMSGVEACQQLHRDRITCHIPVVLLSALAQELYVDNGLGAGPVYYMSKPFSPTVLVSRVRSLLAVARRQVPSPVGGVC